jgi:hypothetical protein
VVTDVLYRLGDVDEAVWTAPEVKVYIREGYNLFVRQTLPLWDYAYLDDVAGVPVYDLPTDCLQVDRVTWNWRRINALLPADARYLDCLYETNRGQVLGYILLHEGIEKLRKWLVPSTTAVPNQDNANTRVEYFQRGSTLAVDLDEFDIPFRCVKYIRFYALGQALGRKGKGQDAALSKHYLARFAVGVGRMLRRKQLSNSARVGRFGGVPTPHSFIIASPRLPWNFGRIVRYRR